MRDVAEVLVAVAALTRAIASVIRALKGNGPLRSAKSRGRHVHRRRG